jgi:trimeric autotransporter adhesin
MKNLSRNHSKAIRFLCIMLVIVTFPIVANAQIISTIAGNGIGSYGGDGGAATAGGINWPVHTAMDGSGNLYFTDYNNARVRKVNTSGVISTYAGNGSSGYSGDGGQATAASLNDPT